MNAMYMIAAAIIKAGSGGGEDEHGDGGNKIDHGENRNYNNSTEYYVPCASLSSWCVVTLIILTQ